MLETGLTKHIHKSEELFNQTGNSYSRMDRRMRWVSEICVAFVSQGLSNAIDKDDKVARVILCPLLATGTGWLLPCPFPELRQNEDS